MLENRRSIQENNSNNLLEQNNDNDQINIYNSKLKKSLGGAENLMLESAPPNFYVMPHFSKNQCGKFT